MGLGTYTHGRTNTETILTTFFVRGLANVRRSARTATVNSD